MNDCFYCENGEKLNSLMIEVCKLDYSTVYLNRDQKHKGRCIVMFKDHKTEYFQLTEEENRGYFAELAKTAQAVWNLYHPDKSIMPLLGTACPMYMYTWFPNTRADFSGERRSMMMWRKCFSRRRNIRRWQKRCGKRSVSLHNPL